MIALPACSAIWLGKPVLGDGQLVSTEPSALSRAKPLRATPLMVVKLPRTSQPVLCWMA